MAAETYSSNFRINVIPAEQTPLHSQRFYQTYFDSLFEQSIRQYSSHQYVNY